MKKIEKIDDLPSSLDEFKESMKTVIFTEKLSNSDFDYRFIEYEFDYQLKIIGLPVIRIPKNVSSSTPPMVNIYDDHLRYLTFQEKEEMLQRLLKIGMIRVSYSSRTGVGSYVFGNLSSFYDFYVIWNDYCKK